MSMDPASNTYESPHARPQAIEITSIEDQAERPCKAFYVSPPDLSASDLPRPDETYKLALPGAAGTGLIYSAPIAPRSEWTITLSDDGQSARVVVPYR